MSGNKRLFQVPTVDEMDVADSQQRKEIPKSHFLVSGATSEGSCGVESSSAAHREDFGPEKTKDAAKDQRPDDGRGAASRLPPAAGSLFQECFSKLTESKQYSEIQKDLKNMRAERPPETLAAAQLPKKPSGSSNCVLVNPRQRGNPLLKSIQNVPFEFADIIPDYVMGRTTCALFLSLRYHNLNPNYIHDRLKQLGHLFDLRILLVLVDVKDPHHTLKELTKISVAADLTVLLAWSSDEAGRYVETYKIFENKPPDMLMKKQEADPCSKLVDALTSVKSINRSDAVVLLTAFGTLENILKASKEDLSLCAGMGPLKASRLHAVLHDTFVKPKKKTK